MVRTIKVYYEYRSQNDDGHYGEDNPEADYPNEVYYPPTWSTYLYSKEILFHEIKSAFDQEDGDEDYSRHIVYIVDEKDKIIYNFHKYKTRVEVERVVKGLIEYAEELKFEVKNDS